MNSSTKTWTFLLLLSFVVITLGHFLGGREGLLWGLIISLGINSFIYFYADQSIINRFSGRQIEGQDPWGVIDIVQNFCEKLRIPTPRVIVIKNSAPQALSIGRNAQHSALVLTEGLLEKANQQELEAIIAYQLASIKRADTLAFGAGAVLCGAILFVTGVFDALFRWIIVEKKASNAPLSHAFTYLSAPIIGFILKLSVNSKLYFECDALAASYLKHPQVLAEVLWKLQSYATTSPFPAPPSTAHLFMVNPLTERGWTRYFQAQPSVERRIRKLVGYYPI